jgi:hypothetical protein
MPAAKKKPIPKTLQTTLRVDRQFWAEVKAHCTLTRTSTAQFAMAAIKEKYNRERVK